MTDNYKNLQVENDALKAKINTLREALSAIRVWCEQPDTDLEDSIGKLACEALSATPAESLQAFENEVISKCAYICDSWKRHDVIDECCDTAQNIALLAVSDAIRALKEVK